MPAYRNTISCDPQTKQQWSDLLAYLYHYWIVGNHPVTFYPSGYCRGALRLDGVIGCKSIGTVVH